ncbi:MAG: C39 family peptidase [Nocardioidaceae bacterium]|nr:C39 family peptidase [Nocardioidaceae bacterium]
MTAHRHVTFTRLDPPHQPAIDAVRGYADPFGDGTERRYECGTWTSPVLRPGFAVTSVVASWGARTPGTAWIEFAARGRPDGAAWSPWLVLGRWADSDAEIHPTTVPDQAFHGGGVDTEEVRIEADRAWDELQLHVALLRREGSVDSAVLDSLGVLTSAVDRGADAVVPPTSTGSLTGGHVLDVPAYSQQVHRNTYPQYDNGGQSWCSPTAVSMVLAYWQRLPTAADYAWVDPDVPDRMVPHAARGCFDAAYAGAGNWSFNVAFAARHGLSAFVTRLRDLTEAEDFVAAGIPLVLSVAHHSGELDGAGYETNGHLLVVSGFTSAGDVVVDDPASHGVASNAEVRTTYRRDQLERVWLRASGGLSYVIHPPDVRLPAAPPEPNW